jgi:hypothetical protein
MNKKEVAEIKKNYNDESGLFALNRLNVVFVSAEKEITYNKNKFWPLVTEAESESYLNMLSGVFKGTIGKNLREFAFTPEAYEEGGVQNLLYTTLKNKVRDTESVDALVKRVVGNYQTEEPYALLIAYSTYSIISKDKNDELTDNALDEYNFITCAICPATCMESGMVYDRERNTFVKRTYTELTISEKPVNGFIYPVFSDRAPDTNAVMSYTAQPNKPNTSFVMDVLGFTSYAANRSVKAEKEDFQSLLDAIMGDVLTYDLATKINTEINTLVKLYKNETTAPGMDAKMLYNVLKKVGVSEDKLQNVESIFKDRCGEDKYCLTNIAEPKASIKTEDNITVALDAMHVDKVTTTIVEGRNCLIIPLDASRVMINGVPTKVHTTANDVKTATDTKNAAENEDVEVITDTTETVSESEISADFTNFLNDAENADSSVLDSTEETTATSQEDEET